MKEHSEWSLDATLNTAIARGRSIKAQRLLRAPNSWRVTHVSNEPDRAQPSVRWLSVEEQQAWRTFLYATTRVRETISHALEHDPSIRLTLAEYEILVRLNEKDDRRMRMSDLAEHVVHSRSRITHTVTRLETRGLVVRERSPDDGRGRVAVLTDEGRAILEHAAPLHVTSVRESLLDPIGTERFLHLGEILEALLTDDQRESIDSLAR